MNMEQWNDEDDDDDDEGDNDGGNSEALGENLTQCYFVYQKF
jgi:hypothetical protein